MYPAETVQPKQGKFRGGWSLVKSAWQTLKLDKELMWIQLLGMIVSILAFVVIAVIGLLVAVSVFNFDLSSVSGREIELNGPGAVLLYLTVGTLLAFISNVFAGAIIAGATERFRGGDPTIGGSLSTAWRRWRPLLLFSLMMTTIGLILQMIEERVPLAGRVAVWLVGAAWNIANIFAVPVIVLKEDVDDNPLNATRESVRVIKNVWGEGVVAHIGLGLVVALSFVLYFLFAGLAVAGVSALTGSGLLVGVVSVAAGIGILALSLLFTTLSGIVKAALYHLAVTGEAPNMFDKNQLNQAFSKKKRRGIAASKV